MPEPRPLQEGDRIRLDRKVYELLAPDRVDIHWRLVEVSGPKREPWRDFGKPRRNP